MIRLNIREFYTRRDRSQKFASHLGMVSPVHPSQPDDLTVNISGDLIDSSGLPDAMGSDELIIMSAAEYERLVSRKVTE